MLTDILEKVGSDTLEKVKVFFPAKIIKYDFKTQTADVAIMQEGLGNAYDIPVIQPSSHIGGIYIPFKQDQLVLLAVFQDDVRDFFKNSTKKTVSNRKFQIRDAIVVSYLSTAKNKSLQENNDDLLITYNKSTIKLKPDGKIEINTTDATLNITNSLIIDKTKTINITNSDTVTLKSSKTNITSELLITGDTKIDGTVTITKDTTIKGNTILEKDLTTKGNLILSGNATIDKDTTIKGNLNVSGTASITGNVTMSQQLQVSQGITCASIDVSGGLTASNATISGINFSSHTHTYTYIIPTQGGSPTQSNTLVPH